MGSSCSPEQGKLFVKLPAPRPANAPGATGGRATILTDGDEAGSRCAASIFEHVAPCRIVQWVKLGEGKQPTDYSGEELLNLLGAYM